MKVSLHILLDSSASMGAMGKIRVAINTAATIKRLSGDLEHVYPINANVQVWRFNETLSTPFGNVNNASGTASLSALDKWLDEFQDSGVTALILSDGFFDDFNTLQKLSAKIKATEKFRLCAIGIGADRNMNTLDMLSSNGKAYNLSEIDLAFRDLLEKSPPANGIAQELVGFACDEEDDEII